MQQNSKPPGDSNSYDGGESVGNDIIEDGLLRDPLIPGPSFATANPELVPGIPLHPANGPQFSSTMQAINDSTWNELNYDDQPSMHGDNVAYEDPEIKHENDIVHPRPYNYEYQGANRHPLHEAPRSRLVEGSLRHDRRYSDHAELNSYGYNQQYSYYREYDQYHQYDDQARQYYTTNDPQLGEFVDNNAMRSTRTLDDIPPELLEGLSQEDKDILNQYPSLLGEPNVRPDHQSQRPPNQNTGHQRSGYPHQNADQMGDAIQRRMSTTLWEEEGTICFVVEVNGIPVTRRCDNNMINGTKLLNSAQISRGRRDGVLKGEKVRHVVKIGGMNFKGVWIPFERALDMASREQVLDALYPLFTANLSGILYNPHHSSRLRQQLAKGARHNPRFNDWINGIPPRSDFSTWHSFNLKGSTPSNYDNSQRSRIKRPSESLSGSLMHPGYEPQYAQHRRLPFRNGTRMLPARTLPPPSVHTNADMPLTINHPPMYRPPAGFTRADQYDRREPPPLRNDGRYGPSAKTVILLTTIATSTRIAAP